MKQDVLDRIRAAEITIVDAPAGFRKSELLRSLAATLDSVRWLHDLDELDSLPPGDHGWVLLDGCVDEDRVAADRISRAQHASGMRLVVAGRGLGPRTRSIGQQDRNELVEAWDLALDADELASSLRKSGTDPAIAESTATDIHRSSAGWPPLASALIDRITSGQSGFGESAEPTVIVDALLGPALAAMEPDTADLAMQLSHMPTVDDGVLTAIGGVGFGERLIAAGFPLVRTPSSGSFVVPPAVATVLGRRRALSAETADRVAPVLVERHMAIEGARLLLRSNGPEAAATLLTELPLAVVDRLAIDDLASILELLESTVERHPRLLLLSARAEGGRARLDAQRQLLERAAAVVDGDDVATVRAEARAELLFLDALASTNDDDAARLTRDIETELQDTSGLDDRRRTRLTEALGVVLASGEHPSALEEASILLDRAARRWEHLGEQRQAAGTLRLLCMQALIPLGRYHEGEAAMRKAAGLGSGDLVEQARNVVVRTRLAALAARPEATERIDEADHLAQTLGLRWLAAYACWSRMMAESVEREPDNVVLLQERTWSELGELQDHATGHIFLCESAIALARVDEIDRARAVLDRALARRDEGELELDLAELAVLARTASVEVVRSRADQLLLSGRVPVARRWSVLLSLAVATHRAAEGGVTATNAEASGIIKRTRLEAELCGLPDLPTRLEPELSEAPAAADRPADVGTGIDTDEGGEPERPADDLTVSVLGGFNLRRGEEAIAISSAKAAQLTKLLSIRDGSAPVDVVIEALWPDVDPQVGRRRLKNVISRARADLGPVIIRERDRMAFSSSVSVDLRDFDLAARRAVLLAQTDPGGACDAAVQALAFYRGDLLPDDLYEDWLEGPRSEHRGRALALIDLARSTPDLSSRPAAVAALVEAVVSIDPTDTARLRDLELLCLQAGNRAAAQAARDQLDRQHYA